MFAILTAVLFPAVVFHGTCIAVLGPGTWGSGMEETLPEFHKPTPALRQLVESLETARSPVQGNSEGAEAPELAGLPGRVRWTNTTNGRRVYLTESADGGGARQRLFADSGNGLHEVGLPGGFIVARPQSVGHTIIAECWNPWAIPPTRKLARYVASWADPKLRPEVAIYQFELASGDWHYVMPGHSLTIAPNRKHATVLRSGALLAGYYSIHLWEIPTGRAPAILSLREHGGRGSQSFSFRWTDDSSAFQILGSTDGFERRSSQRGSGPGGIAINLLYVLGDNSLYDLGPKG